MPPKPINAAPVTRFSVSLPPRLLERLDRMVADQGFPSRSQALAEMIEWRLVDHSSQDPTQVMAGTITLVYQETGDRLRARLAVVQRRYLKEVIASQHVFLEADHALEVLLVQGPAATLQSLRDEIVALKGVKSAELTLTPALLPPLH